MAVANSVQNGWRVEYQGPDSAVLVAGRKANHVLHLLLTVFTVGLWAVVWLIVALSSSEKRTTVRVDDYGNLTWQ